MSRTCSPRRTLGSIALAVGALGLAAAPAAAQSWNATTGAAPPWGTATNWNPASVPNSATAVATFSGTGAPAVSGQSPVNVDAAFTVGTLQFNTAAGPGGGYNLSGTGSLTIGGATPTLTNAIGNNAINARLSATGLAATVSGGTLTLGNTSSATPNALTGTITVNSSATLTAVVAGTVGTGSVLSVNTTSVGTSSLGSAAVALNGGTLNLQGALVTRSATEGGATGQFYDISLVGGVNPLVNSDGFVGFPGGRTDYRVRNAFDANGTPDRTRANAALNVLTPKTLGGGAPGGTTAVNTGATSALTPPTDSANFYFGGLSFANAGDGRVFGQPVNTVPGQGSTTDRMNVGQYAQTNHLARFAGVLTIVNAGNYSFNTQSDDASLVYIDGKLVVNNNVDQGTAGFGGGRFGPINYGTNPAGQGSLNLAAGSHTIEVLYQQGGGGAGMIVNYFGNNNPGQDDTGGVELPIPGFNPITNSVVLRGFQAQVSMGNNVTLAAGTSSTINATQAFQMSMGALTFGAGSTLTTGLPTPAGPAGPLPGGTAGNAYLRFSSTALAAGANNTVVASGTNDVGLGTLSSVGAATLIKQGTQNLILDGGNPAAGTGPITFEIQNGRLMAVTDVNVATPANPLGTGGIVRFNTTGAGSVSTLQLRTRNAVTTAPTFDNAIQVNLSDGILEAATHNAAAATINLGSATNGITIAATRTLIVDSYNNATLNLVGPLSGAGTLRMGDNPQNITLPNQPTFLSPPLNNGTGTLQLSANNSGFTGPVVINTGTVTLNNASALSATSGITIVGPQTYFSWNADTPQVQINQSTQNGGTLGLAGNINYANVPLLGTVIGAGAVGRNGVIDNISGTNQFSTASGRITLAGSTSFGASGGTLTLNSPFNDGGSATPFTITKNGGGTLNLAVAANTLANGTNLTVTGGTLNINVANAVGNTGTVTVTGGTLNPTLVGALGTATSPAVINQTGGTLNANVTGNIGTQAVVTHSGGTWNVSANQTVNSLAGGPAGQILNLTNASALTVGAANTSTIYGGTVNGNGSIVKSGTGSLTLTGGNSFGGGVRLNTGTLVAGSLTSMGSGPVTLAGGTLNLGNVSNTGVPLTATGWNQDVVWGLADVNPNPANGFGTTTGVDNNSVNGGFGFYEQGVATARPTVGLPAGSRTLVSITNPSVTFQLQPYNASNVLYLTNQNNLAGTLTLTTPQQLGSLNILHTTGSGSATYNATINFTDSTSTTVNNVTSPDWFNNNPFATAGFDRYQRNNGNFAGVENQPNPRLYELDILLAPADASKLVQSITITRTNAAGFLNIFAISGGNITTNSTYANSVVVPANATPTITTSILSTQPATVTMGALTFQSGTTTALTVTPDTVAPANVAYTVNFGATTLAGTSTLTVNNNGTAAGTVTLGALTDAGVAATLTKAGSGVLTLTGSAGTITNGTQINVTGGTLNANNASALGTLARVDLSASTTLNVGATQTLGALNAPTGSSVNLGANTLTVGAANNLNSTVGGVIAGTGGLTKAGTGTLLLNGTNTYTGTTTVNAGTLGGTGSIAGPLVVNGGTVSPGTSPGKFTVNGSITFTGALGGGLLAELNGTGQGTTYDWLMATGAVSLSSSGAILGTTLGYAPAPTDSLTILSGSSLTGAFANAPAGQPFLLGSFGGQLYAANVGYTANSVVLSGFQPVPEPAHLLLLCGGAVGAVRFWRRRRSGAAA